MFLKLLDEYEKFLAEGGTISPKRHDARFEFALWLEQKAAQQSVNPTVLNVREIETICPNCNLVFDVPVPESHSG
jgi:hypothetical protein